MSSFETICLSSLALILAIISTLVIEANTSNNNYKATVSQTSTSVVISRSLLQNSIYEYSYNSASWTDEKGTTCLLVRCQNRSTTKNPLGPVTPSKIAISCDTCGGVRTHHSINRLVGAGANDENKYNNNNNNNNKMFCPISPNSIIFEPTSPFDVLGTEDPRVKLVNGTLYMYYTAVSPSPAGGATARLSLATCDTTKFRPSDKQCWIQHGQLFPDPVKGEQFTKSGALLIDDKIPLQHQQPCLIYGDSTVVIGLQVAVPTSVDLLSYQTIQNFLLIKPRPRSFDSELVESGPPPLQLDDGNWFFIYNSAQRLYGVPNQLFYNPGWVVLNSSNPLEVLARSDEPLMMPSHLYETKDDGKLLTPYVIFVEGMQKKGPCVKNEEGTTSCEFVIFYGAGDSQVGSAVVEVTY